MCQHAYVYSSWAKTCVNCGIESYFISLDTYSVYSAPLERGYSRSQRFRIKLDKLLALHSGPNCEDPIWKYLDSKKLFLNNPFDVRQCIRSSKLKLKHYDCVRIFSNAFTPFRVTLGKSPLVLKKILLRKFETIFYRWMQTECTSFFSYDWILRYFLEELKSPLVVYLKPKTCRKRNKKYIDKLHNFEKAMELRVVATKETVLGMCNSV